MRNFITIENINQCSWNKTITFFSNFIKVIIFRRQISVANIINNSSIFFITKKIKRLIYRLTISNHWQIHSIFNVVQLKKCFSSSTNFFNRLRLNYSNLMYVNDDTFIVKFFEIIRIINKREIKKRNTKYFVQ